MNGRVDLSVADSLSSAVPTLPPTPDDLSIPGKKKKEIDNVIIPAKPTAAQRGVAASLHYEGTLCHCTMHATLTMTTMKIFCCAVCVCVVPRSSSAARCLAPPSTL